MLTRSACPLQWIVAAMPRDLTGVEVGFLSKPTDAAAAFGMLVEIDVMPTDPPPASCERGIGPAPRYREAGRLR